MERTQMSMRFSTVVTAFIFVCFCFLTCSGLPNLYAGQPPERIDEGTKQAEQALRTYLQLRKSEEEAKRYKLLSKNAKWFLLKQYGVSDEQELEKFMADLAGFGDFQILKLKQLNKDKVQASVRVQIITEHPDGGVTSEEVFQFFLVREDDQWKLDEILKKDGTRFLP